MVDVFQIAAEVVALRSLLADSISFKSNLTPTHYLHVKTNPDGHHSGIHVSEEENRGGEFYSGASDL
ncbi:hypothetical protein F2Q68_00044603 [Brassica cretica]|uniref:Uncharacterized protein n=1 Tax=Brassica cretica TaxID=69181 RepID=A0A8S9LS82_BRACR|nr:hypothetical protein F2Q68_00044603 [Brassica cretica]KAF3523733.1 hypothetical protein F2Q69_00048403 [Brassica cretica]